MFGEKLVLESIFLFSYTSNSAERGDNEKPHVEVQVLNIDWCACTQFYTLLSSLISTGQAYVSEPNFQGIMDKYHKLRISCQTYIYLLQNNEREVMKMYFYG